MIWPIAYVVFVLIAQYTALWFIPLPIPIVGGALTIGTISFGVTFTARDRAHRLGKLYVYIMIAVAVLGSIVETLMLGIPGQIIIASVIAIAISESVDTEIYHKLLDKSWIVRVLSSNAISVPLDSILFASIAFYGLLPISIIVQIVYTETIIKYIVALIVAIRRRDHINNTVLAGSK